MTDELFDTPKLDEFKTESPLRAFASYDMMGLYLIAKGFRPSLGHLTRYLDAMETKEGWQFVQVLEAATGVPTIIFRAVEPREAVTTKPEPITHLRTMTIRGLDTEHTHWSAASWNGNPEDLMDRLKIMTYGATRAQFLEQENVEDMRHYWRTASVASVLRLIDRLGVWDQCSLADPISYDELTKAIGREPSALCVRHHSVNREEVTSESPVDALERMAEQAADELGLDVDRESFQVAREHVEEMVPLDLVATIDQDSKVQFYRDGQPVDNDDLPWTPHGGYEVPDDQREEAARYVIERMIHDSKYRLPMLRDFKKTFMNPKGTPLPPHDKLDKQLQFIIGGGTDIVVIRNWLASFRMVKQGDKAPADHVDVTMTNHPDGRMEVRFDDANPAHYNGWECGDIGERLTANGYQILKYCWRLGKKDDPCKELGKALRYLERERDLMVSMGAVSHHQQLQFTAKLVGIKNEHRHKNIFLERRISEQSEFTQEVARFLWHGYTVHDLKNLKAIIADHKARLDCGHGLAI